MERFIGRAVSVRCHGSLGHYQGLVGAINVDRQTVNLTKTFHNGLPLGDSSVTLNVGDIDKLELMETTANIQQSPSKSRVSQPPLKNRNAAACESVRQNASGDGHCSPRRSLHSPRKNIREGFKSKQRLKNEECFADNISIPDEDFDFETNLALFDKQALNDQLSATQTGSDASCGVNRTGAPPSITSATAASATYRHNQNVLADSTGDISRQIVVPEPVQFHYVTDSGVCVPAVSASLCESVLAACRSAGICDERLLESLGRCCCELCLQLVGASTRLTPENTHQKPRIVFLCGAHNQGAAGINAARQLGGHSVSVWVYVPSLTLSSCTPLATELRLLALTDATLTHSVDDLPSCADLIVSCLDEQQLWQQLQLQPWHRAAVHWANNCRAPVLAFDPPARPPAAPPELEPRLAVRHCLAAVLPLVYGDMGGGRVYLANLAVPVSVWRSLRVQYVSPFTQRAVVALHRRA